MSIANEIIANNCKVTIEPNINKQTNSIKDIKISISDDVIDVSQVYDGKMAADSFLINAVEWFKDKKKENIHLYHV
jgi:hypothetical protein